LAQLERAMAILPPFQGKANAPKLAAHAHLGDVR